VKNIKIYLDIKSNWDRAIEKNARYHCG